LAAQVAADAAQAASDDLQAAADAARAAAESASAAHAKEIEAAAHAAREAEARVEQMIEEARHAAADRERLASELESLRVEVQGAGGAIDARLEALEAARAEADRLREEADARADEALDERDALLEKLEAAKQAVQGMQAAVDARLEVIDAKRNRNVQALKESVEAITSERDALAEELSGTRRLLEDAAQARHWLEVAEARVRALELQLFERDRELQDRDVELSSLLDAPTPPSEKATRRATRYRLAKTTKVQLDGVAGELVDLSIGGAQLLCPKQPEVNSVVTLSLPSDGPPLPCQGRIVWAWLEPHSKGRPLRYRAGLLFTGVDEAAIEAYIAKYAAS